jgi:hypothetical protein
MIARSTLFAGAALLLLAACGSTGGSPSGSTTAPPRSSAPAAAQQTTTGSSAAGAGVPTYRVSIHVTGAFTQDFQITSSQSYGQGSCAQRAAHGQDPTVPASQQAFSIPAPSYNPNVAIVATIRRYTGPGTYGQDQIGNSTVTVNNTAPFSVGGQSGTITATVSADGSGSLTFAGAEQLDPGKPTLSGSVTWTCTDGG